MTNTVTESIIKNIIQTQMGLDPSRVWLRSQNLVVPNDQNLYVVVGMVDSKPYGSSLEVVYTPIPDTDPVQYTAAEVQKVATAEHIQIDIASRNTDALFRRNEIIMALRSIYAQQQMEASEFKISRLPVSFVNASGPEGGSNLNRFVVTIVCNALYIITNNLPQYDYYDDFNTRADDEKTIGTDTPLFEFEIKNNEIIGG